MTIAHEVVMVSRKHRGWALLALAGGLLMVIYDKTTASYEVETLYPLVVEGSRSDWLPDPIGLIIIAISLGVLARGRKGALRAAYGFSAVATLLYLPTAIAWSWTVSATRWIEVMDTATRSLSFGSLVAVTLAVIAMLRSDGYARTARIVTGLVLAAPLLFVLTFSHPALLVLVLLFAPATLVVASGPYLNNAPQTASTPVWGLSVAACVVPLAALAGLVTVVVTPASSEVLETERQRTCQQASREDWLVRGNDQLEKYGITNLSPLATKLRSLHFHRFDFYPDKSDHEALAGNLIEVLESCPEMKPILSLNWSQVSEQKTKKLEQLLDKIVQKNPRDIETLVFAGETLTSVDLSEPNLNRFKRGFSYLESAVAMAPQNDEVTNQYCQRFEQARGLKVLSNRQTVANVCGDLSGPR